MFPRIDEELEEEERAYRRMFALAWVMPLLGLAAVLLNDWVNWFTTDRWSIPLAFVVAEVCVIGVQQRHRGRLETLIRVEREMRKVRD